MCIFDSIPPRISPESARILSFPQIAFMEETLEFSFDSQWFLDYFAIFFMDLLDLVTLHLWLKSRLNRWSIERVFFVRMFGVCLSSFV